MINEDFMTILNEEKKHRDLKESIRMVNSQISDVEKISLIEGGKKIRVIRVNEVIKHNEIINNNSKYVSTKMESYCLKCKKKILKT